MCSRFNEDEIRSVVEQTTTLPTEHGSPTSPQNVQIVPSTSENLPLYHFFSTNRKDNLNVEVNHDILTYIFVLHIDKLNNVLKCYIFS